MNAADDRISVSSLCPKRDEMKAETLFIVCMYIESRAIFAQATSQCVWLNTKANKYKRKFIPS